MAFLLTAYGQLILNLASTPSTWLSRSCGSRSSRRRWRVAGDLTWAADIFELVINIFTVRVDCELRVPALGPAHAAGLGHGGGDGRRDGEGGEHEAHRADVLASLPQSSIITPLYNWAENDPSVRAFYGLKARLLRGCPYITSAAITRQGHLECLHMLT